MGLLPPVPTVLRPCIVAVEYVFYESREADEYTLWMTETVTSHSGHTEAGL